jgi:hypothetical protein
MNKEASNDVISQILLPEEKLIWTGKPKKGIVFEFVDVFKTIYAAIFLYFTYFAVKLLSEISLLLAIPVALVFFSFGFLIAFVRFFIDAELRKQTYYGTTDKRIITVSNLHPKKTQSVYFHTKPKIEFSTNVYEISTFDIGLKEPSGMGRNGLAWFPKWKGYTYLYRITDGVFVYRKIIELTEQTFEEKQ